MAIKIEKQLQHILFEVIRRECSECSDLPPSSLAPGLFLCDTPIVYRSTLVNPLPTTNASHLVGIIQTWVSTEPTLNLNGIVMKAQDSNCPTAISSLIEDICTTPDPSKVVSHAINMCASVNFGKGREFTCDLWPGQQQHL